MPRKYWLLLFAAAAALLFAGNGSLLITDSVESNYALTAKEMVLSGDWLSPQITGMISRIAVPFSEQRSAKDLGDMLTENDVHKVGLYGKYPTSAVFYSSSKVVKLMHEREVAGYVPKDFSWTGKNVMPYATLERNPYRIVVVTPKSYDRFIAQQNKKWQVIDADSSWIMLRMQNS